MTILKVEHSDILYTVEVNNYYKGRAETHLEPSEPEEVDYDVVSITTAHPKEYTTFFIEDVINDEAELHGYVLAAYKEHTEDNRY